MSSSLETINSTSTKFLIKYVNLEFRMLKQLVVTSKITTIAALLLLFPTIFAIVADAHPSLTPRQSQQQESLQSDALWNSNITQELFEELKELARIADISYCAGTYGISKPFVCTTHCKEFPNFELVETFHSSYLPNGGCGYIAIDHGSGQNNGRILVVFRGTHSITDVITDMLMVPQEYTPYSLHPENENVESVSNFLLQPLHGIIQRPLMKIIRQFSPRWTRAGQGHRKNYAPKCTNCTVHLGFWKNYRRIRHLILTNIRSAREKYPEYQLNLVGHSLGGAVATLAALELESLGYSPLVTTFGEPRLGNHGLRDYIDATFNLRSENSNSLTGFPSSKSRFRRVTHINDPFPLLPTNDLNYRPHAGEIFISKRKTPQTVENLRLCFGDEDVNCIAGGNTGETLKLLSETLRAKAKTNDSSMANEISELKKRGTNGILIPNLLQLYFSHVDYFTRMDLCFLPGGGPIDLKSDEI
ncbi:Lipase A [Erysiphe neolycopersici]|uniref:Lipase A n=1 Tax=Erysiphe neolycopersici TaxID=212602 RepID=A0A420HRS2_9PEZI|nr:Lipase A [Erysiphe neolycopersici]